MKTCGTREYRCDCGTLFSRRDSFITHRAFCDALAQESGRSQPPPPKVQVVSPPPPPAVASSPPPPPLTPSTGVMSPVLSVQSSAELPENQIAQLQPPPPPKTTVSSASTTTTATPSATATVTASSTVFSSIFNASTCGELPQSSHQTPSYTASLLRTMDGADRPAIDPISLSLSSSLYGASSLFPSTSQNHQQHYIPSPQPALSATALLQKAAQMGSTSSNPPFLRGLWWPVSSPLDRQDNVSTMASATSSTPSHVKIENNSLASGLGLGLPSSGFNNDLMMSSSALFGNKPTTLDFLGLGMGGDGEASSGGFSAFLSSINGGLDMGAGSFAGVSPAGDTWDDPSDRKHSIL